MSSFGQSWNTLSRFDGLLYHGLPFGWGVWLLQASWSENHIRSFFCFTLAFYLISISIITQSGHAMIRGRNGTDRRLVSLFLISVWFLFKTLFQLHFFVCLFKLTAPSIDIPCHNLIWQNFHIAYIFASVAPGCIPENNCAIELRLDSQALRCPANRILAETNSLEKFSDKKSNPMVWWKITRMSLSRQNQKNPKRKDAKQKSERWNFPSWLFKNSCSKHCLAHQTKIERSNLFLAVFSLSMTIMEGQQWELLVQVNLFGSLCFNRRPACLCKFRDKTGITGTAIAIFTFSLNQWNDLSSWLDDNR